MLSSDIVERINQVDTSSASIAPANYTSTGCTSVRRSRCLSWRPAEPTCSVEPSMALSHPPSPSQYRTSTAAQHPPVTTATLLPSKLSASHFAAFHTYHRDLCRQAATLPRQLSDHYNNLQTLRSTSRSFSSHLSRLTTHPTTATTTSVLERFTSGVELLHVAVVQQLDVALARLVECVGTLAGSVESMTRLCDSLRTSAVAVDVQLLVLDVAAVREMEKIVAGSTAGSPLKAAGGGSATGSHRKQKPTKQQPATQDDDSDPSLTAAISPYTLLLTLEDIVYTLTALQQQHAAALAHLQAAVRGGGEKSEDETREALDVLGSSGSVNGSMLEEWLSIIRRACKV